LAVSQSAGNLDQQIGTEAFSSIVPFVKAAMAAVQGRHEESIDIYRTVLPLLAQEGLSDMRPQILADMAWCFANLEQHDAAKEHGLLAEQSLRDIVHVEDLLIAHGRLGQVFALLGDAERATKYSAMALSTLGAQRELQQRFVDAVDGAGVAVKGKVFPAVGRL